VDGLGIIKWSDESGFRCKDFRVDGEKSARQTSKLKKKSLASVSFFVNTYLFGLPETGSDASARSAQVKCIVSRATGFGGGIP